MNIALIGVPGAGKTDLAERLATELRRYNPDCGCRDQKVAIVDDYVAVVEERSQIAMGTFADYLGNLYVALERFAGERTHRLDDTVNVVITCGTLLETAVYQAMHLVALSANLDEEGRAEAAPRIDASLRILSLLYNDIFTYDYAFYLPPVEQSEDAKFMDQQLQAGLEGFKLMEIVPLIEADTQLPDLLAAITKVPEVTPA